MRKYRAFVIVMGIVCITILEIVAVYNGYNGAALTASCSTIAGLSTYLAVKAKNP